MASKGVLYYQSPWEFPQNPDDLTAQQRAIIEAGLERFPKFTKQLKRYMEECSTSRETTAQTASPPTLPT
jgi:hypothetical protein